MIYKVEESLKYFKFWGQAQTVAREFTDEQLEQLEDLISDMFCDDYPTDTQINDLFAYDSDYLKELLGWKKLLAYMFRCSQRATPTTSQKPTTKPPRKTSILY